MEQWMYFCCVGLAVTIAAKYLFAQMVDTPVVERLQQPKKIHRTLLILPVCFSFLALVSPAFAADVFKVAINQGNDVLEKSIPILKSLAVLGILGVGGMAMTGRMPWSWAFAIIGGLSLLSVAMYTRDWIGYISTSAQSTGKFEDVANTLKTTNEKLAFDAQSLLYTAAAVSIISVGIMGIFGKFRWSWLFATTAGMAIITAAAFVNVFVGTGK
jgi:type IV secretory pathway VirB2 component (pilin)